MKRAASEDPTERKRRCCNSSQTSAPRIGRSQSLQPAFSNPLSHVSNHTTSLDQTWAEHVGYITDWVENVSDSPASSTNDSAQVPDSMSDSSSLRGRRRRSCSPTKKSDQYRSTVLKPNNILVDTTHSLPPEIEVLLPHGLRDILDHVLSPEGTPTDIHNKVNELATVYRNECRELSKKPGSEPEYRAHLFNDVVEKLARLSLWRDILSADCSDRIWHASLKPPAPTPVLSLTWPSLPSNFTGAKLSQTTSFMSSSFVSSTIRVRPDEQVFDITSPLPPIDPSESSTNSELEGSITTPKPDITVGISREVFNTEHAGLLNYLQSKRRVLSDPHATQGAMRFVILLIEAKGLATNGNLIGAQNQAAGAGTCAVRLLESLTAQDPASGAPRIVFSFTTEGAIHELWIHYRMDDRNKVPKYHMTCLGVWRITLDHHAQEFIAALASILQWGAEVFYPQITQSLDRILHSVKNNNVSHCVARHTVSQDAFALGYPHSSPRACI